MSEDYFNEKKKVFFIEIDNGDRGGAFFYRLEFADQITRLAFLEIMNEAKASDNRYADLYDREFWKKHFITKFEEISVDYQDMLEERYQTVWYNPETGKYEEEDE